MTLILAQVAELEASQAKVRATLAALEAKDIGAAAEEKLPAEQAMETVAEPAVEEKVAEEPKVTAEAAAPPVEEKPGGNCRGRLQFSCLYPDVTPLLRRADGDRGQLRRA